MKVYFVPNTDNNTCKCNFLYNTDNKHDDDGMDILYI
jgi:hypothetical protein